MAAVGVAAVATLAVVGGGEDQIRAFVVEVLWDERFSRGLVRLG